jgi:hypothetical protein
MKSVIGLVNMFLLINAGIYSLGATARFPVQGRARGGLKRGYLICGSLLLVLLLVFGGWQAARAADVKQVPLWDGETSATPDGWLINRYGGPVVHLGAAKTTVSHVTDVVHSGHGAYRAAIDGPVSDYAFFQLALSGFGPTADYVMSRDILRFDSLCFWIKNETGVAFTLKLEIKDYRDSNDHRQFRYYLITAGGVWTKICAPLSTGWTLTGNPDLRQARLIGFVFEAAPGSPLTGAVYFDDVVLVEPGSAMDPETAPLRGLVEQIARRQFDGLWGSRSHIHGLIPLNSVYADVGALNSTAGLVKLLPVACQQGWITREEANAYLATLVATLNILMNQATYLPPRYLNWLTLAPNYIREESPVDAAFLALALYQYSKSLPALPPDLQSQIEALLARFNFAACGSPQGWKLAYKYDPPGFTAGTYDGYSGEIWTISLAAHLMPANWVDISTYYHSGINRVKTSLVSPNQYVVHSYPDFRAPFLQWLFSLFVKLDKFPLDNYPVSGLATNPLRNAILYQQDVDLYLGQQGRSLFLQPDAGDDGSGSHYEQYSCYNNFGEPDLFMPWSVAFSLLGDPSSAEPALRNHLKYGLHGPLGLSDSVRWTTGAPGPSQITARHDFWNVSLATMAMTLYLYQDNEFLTNLPEVHAALREVFPWRMGGVYWLLLLAQ